MDTFSAAEQIDFRESAPKMSILGCVFGVLSLFSISLDTALQNPTDISRTVRHIILSTTLDCDSCQVVLQRLCTIHHSSYYH